MSTRTWLFVPTAALAAVMVAACGSEPEFPEQPAPTASVPTPAPTPTPVASSPPPPPAVTSGPCDVVQTTAFTTMLLARQPSEAPRMEQVGGLVCGSAPEGQAVSGPTFMLEPGYCYTVLGNALPNVSELDVQMVVDLAGGGIPPALAALAAAPVAVDNTTGPTAAVGPGQSCFQWAMPFPGAVKLVVKPRTGGGPVAAQVYRRKK